jgi:hypothetical protein
MGWMGMYMRRKMHRNPIMDQRRMWATESMVGFTWEPVMLTRLYASMGSMSMRYNRIKYRKAKKDQRRMWRIEGIVQESVKSGQHISDL